MKVVVTGGGGFLGARLAAALFARGRLIGADGSERPISRIALLDRAFPPVLPQDARLSVLTGDVADPDAVGRAITPDTESIFHLAAVVSGEAEANFDLGMRVNLDGFRCVLEHARRCARPPRMVYTSSVAAFGGELPPVLDDTTVPAPQTSYGTQKVAGEYLLADYSRKGFIDGRALRLPTIVVRPGKANAAASSFASAIVREPLNGVTYECPVGPRTGIWLLSPGRAVEAFVHAHELPAPAWRGRRVLNLPGLATSVQEMVDAMGRLAGAEAVRRIVWRTDPVIEAIVRTWPVRFQTPRALSLGFKGDDGVESVIRSHIAER
jgi:nucleoside-diphosphate-sugar epimerase